MLNRARSVVFDSVARTASENSGDQSTNSQKGIRLILNVSAASGVTPTLDVKIQAKDGTSGNYLDVTGASFAQKTGTGTDDLVIYPGITTTANRRVSDVIPNIWRAVATIGGTTPSFTFSLTADAVP